LTFIKEAAIGDSIRRFKSSVISSQVHPQTIAPKSDPTPTVIAIAVAPRT
jgi:hypothetical protein